MQKLKFYIVILLIVFIAIHCKKSPELDNKDIPVFIGEVVPLVSYKEVSFSVAFENSETVIMNECGFEWGERLRDTSKVVNVSKISAYNFSAEVNSILDESKEYVVRAWVKIRSKKCYSKPTYFKGLVALKPEIISISKSYAIWGDTIKVKVRNLSKGVLCNDIKAKINNIEAETLHADSIEIAIIMPYIETAGNFKISLQVNGQSCANTVEIENALPVINSVSPEKMHWEDTISIKGKFRPEYSNRLLPYMDPYTPYKILSYTTDEITIKPSEWTENCQSEFDIYIKILKTPLETWDFNGYNTLYHVDRTGHWNTLGKAAPGSNSKGVLINGEAFVLEMDSPESTSRFWKYNPLTDQWSALKEYPAKISSDGALLISNGNIYAGLQKTTGENPDFYKYDILNNIWIKCASPGMSLSIIPPVTIQDKIYAFCYVGSGDYKAVYNPISDSWAKSVYTPPNFYINYQWAQYCAKSFSWFIYNQVQYFYDGAGYIYKTGITPDVFVNMNFNLLYGNGYGPLFTLNGRCFCLYGGCQIHEFNMSEHKEIKRMEFTRWPPEYYGSPDYYSAPLFEYNNKKYFLIQPHTMISFSTENE